jgi:protein phosphatase 1 regulatory subunit 7
MNHNQIPDLQTLISELGATTTLETLYLEGNPCQMNDEAYRRKVKLYLPQLQQIDATCVSHVFS